MNRKNVTERRRDIIGVVLQADERAKVEELAAAEGLSLSAVVRRAILLDLRKRARHLTNRV